MNSLVANQHTDDYKKGAKSASPDLQAMHDQKNNLYHSSLYRHQAQTRQQNDRSATTFNGSASCDSPASPFSPTLPLSPVFTTASAPPSIQNVTLSYHPHSASDYPRTLIDYESLNDAMKSSSSSSPLSSIDLTTVHLSQHETGDSLETMQSFLRKHDTESTQELDTMNQFGTIFSFRVMYLGVASSDERYHFLKKLSDGLCQTLFYDIPSTLPTHSLAPSTNPYSKTASSSSSFPPPCSCQFLERKHHILPLDMFLANNGIKNDDDDNSTIIFEDSGISIVEADFTTDPSNPHNRHQQNHRHDPELILHYIYTQLEHQYPITTLQTILNPPSHWDSQSFNGRIYSDEKSNGIDLCVYFYHDAQGIDQVDKDMEILWKIGALGISILPIISMSQQIPPLSPYTPHLTTDIPPTLLSPKSQPFTNTTRTSAPSPSSKHHPFDEHGLEIEGDNNNDSNNNTTELYLKQRLIDTRRNELAYLFSLWRIKMMDISNLDIFGQPSFQSKGKSRWNSTHYDSTIEKLLGQVWATSSLVSPTPCHVLTHHQFMAIDRWDISKLLMATKDRAKEYRHQNDIGCDNSGSVTTAPTSTTAPATHNSLSTDTTSTPSLPPRPSSPSLSLSSTTPKAIITVQTSKEIPTTPTTIDSSSYHPSQLLLLDYLHVPLKFYIFPLIFVLVLIFVLWNSSDSLLSSVLQRSTWCATLTMVSHHQCGKSLTFAMNVYYGQDQLKWAPQLPLLATNLPLTDTNLHASSLRHNGYCTVTPFTYSTISKDTDLDALAPMIVMPLPNETQKSQPIEGQYFYRVPMPSCSTLNISVDYYVRVKPSAIFSSKTPGKVQGSPVSIPKTILCGNSSSLVDFSMGSDHANRANIMEALIHFRQHIRFYLRNGIKIINLMITEGFKRDEYLD